MTSNQYGALTSFTYNEGCGVIGYVAADMNAGNHAAVFRTLDYILQEVYYLVEEKKKSLYLIPKIIQLVYNLIKANNYFILQLTRLYIYVVGPSSYYYLSCVSNMRIKCIIFIYRYGFIVYDICPSNIVVQYLNLYSYLYIDDYCNNR